MFVLNPNIAYREKEGVYILINRKSGQQYEIGMQEYSFLIQYASDNNLANIDGVEWSQEKITQLIALFKEHHILVEESSKRIVWEKNIGFDISRMRLFEFRPRRNNVKTKTCEKVGSIVYISGGVSTVWCIISFLVICNLGIFTESIGQSVVWTLSRIELIDLVAICGFTLLSMAIHELGHYIICKLVCGTAGNIGVVLMFLLPTLYCNVSDVCLVERKKRNPVYLAGTVFQICFTAITFTICLVVLLWYEEVLLVLFLFSVFNFIMALTNLFPFIKTDGYWILSNIVKVEDLYDKANEYWMGKLIGRNIEPGKVRPVVKVYGVCSLISQMMIWGSMIFPMALCIALIIKIKIYLVFLSLCVIVWSFVVWTKIKSYFPEKREES